MMRFTLAPCMCLVGPEKTVVLVDSTGTEEQWLFRKQDFDVWSHAHSLMQLLPDGRKQVVASWELLEEGGRYLTNMLLDKPVCALGLPHAACADPNHSPH
jgi:hypothetical protein